MEITTMRTQTKISLIVFLIITLGCAEEKIPKLFNIYFPKYLPPDSSLACQVKDTIVEGTLYVEIKVTNKFEKPVYLPVNNWYFDGWPQRQFVECSYYFIESFPDFNKTYHLNTLLFCEDNEWKNPTNKFFMPALPSFPIIQKLNPGKSFYFKLTILNYQFIADSIHKLNIKGNILYALSDAHKKLINTLNIDENKVLREFDTIEYSCNMNSRPWGQKELAHGFVLFTDSTKIDERTLYPGIEENTFRENLLLFRKLFLQYRKIGYSFEKDDPENFNLTIDEYNAEPEKFTELGESKPHIGYLFFRLLKETYCYSVKFKNY